MKEKIIELLRSAERTGMENLIDYMANKSDFFTAPCSTQHHLCKPGGLAEHSLNVYSTMFDVCLGMTFDKMPHMDDASIIIASLLHDIGKSTYRGRSTYEPNYLTSGKISDKKPYEVNKASYFNHELKSILIAKQFIELTEDEEFAIYYHNGMYEKSGYEITGKERPLQLLLHFADMWCGRFIEKGGAE